jgi:hypothetical protein
MRRARLAIVLLLPACYRYIADGSAVSASPGADARLVLTPAGAASLAPVLGRETAAVEGRVMSRSDSVYVVSVSATLKRVQGASSDSALSRTAWAGESVTIPRAAVAETERRSLDSRRTVVAATVFTAAAVAAVRLIVHSVGSSGGGGDTGGPVVTP